MVSPKRDCAEEEEQETVAEARARIDKLWRTGASASGSKTNSEVLAGVKESDQFAIAKTEPIVMLHPVEEYFHERAQQARFANSSAGAYAHDPSRDAHAEIRPCLNAAPARPSLNLGAESNDGLINLLNLTRFVTAVNVPTASETRQQQQQRQLDNVGELQLALQQQRSQLDGTTSPRHSTSSRSSHILTSIVASLEAAVQHPSSASGTSRGSHSRVDHSFDEDLDEEEGQAPAPEEETDQVMCNPDLKAAIAAHPLYPTMVLAHIRILQIGAPRGLQAKLNEIAKKYHRLEIVIAPESFKLGQDPELDNFMRAYTLLLTRFREDLEEPFNKVMQFMDSATKDLEDICGHYVDTKPEEEGNYGYDVASSAGGMDGSTITHCVDGSDDCGAQVAALVDQADELLMSSAASLDDDVDESIVVDPEAPEEELKRVLMRKYGRRIGGLKAEFNRVRKKGKLPSASRQILKNWFNHHSYWPYPSEMEKAHLQRLCNLDLKQVNNWFINERKRHWSSEEKCLQDPNAAFYDLRASNVVPDDDQFSGPAQYYQEQT